MTTASPGRGLSINEDVAFDRRLARLRRFSWALLIPVLAIGGWMWKVPGPGIGSTVLRTAVVYLLVLLALRLGAVTRTRTRQVVVIASASRVSR